MSYIDTEKTYKRGPQIITRKDAGAIVARVGLQPNWRCLDLGGGSGFLALFLANLTPSGSVTTYEIKKEHAEIIKKNIGASGFRNVKLVNKPAEKFAGGGFDLITMDVKGAEKIIPRAYRALRSCVPCNDGEGGIQKRHNDRELAEGVEQRPRLHASGAQPDSAHGIPHFRTERVTLFDILFQFYENLFYIPDRAKEYSFIKILSIIN